MKQSHQRHLTTMLVLLLVLAAFLVGHQTAGSGAGTPAWASFMSGSLTERLDPSINLKPVELFQEALGNLQRQYVEPVDKTDQLTYAAIRGMLAELKDPYTRFMDPKEYAEFTSDNVGRFAGIGATLNMVEVSGVKPKDGEGTMAPVKCPNCGEIISDTKHYRVAIVEPMPGSPAEKAGLKPGDFILKVDDTLTDGLMVGDVADKIRGEKGTQVTLSIGRKSEDKPLTITITRDEIEVPAVQSKVLDNHIGYLRLYQFNEKTVEETRDALLKFNDDKVQGVVLNLRSNPGGLLTECIKVASMMLPDNNKVIVSTKGRDGRSRDETRIPGAALYKGPMVVLVNKGSASASEILTGALKDYHRATIIGESTFGKALVQVVLPMSGGSAMAVTTAHYYTPSGFDLHKKGIAPDVTVALDKDATTISENDNQAQTALRLLKEEMAKAQ